MLRRAAAPVLAGLVLCLAALLPSAAAFDSVPGGPHDDITQAAARLAGFPEKGIPALVEAVRAPDVDDNKLDPKADKVTRFDVTDSYRPSHHCDRVPPAGDVESFNATVAYVTEQGESARNRTLAGDAEGAVQALGAALHAVEDCLSHSNAIDLSEPGEVVHAVNGHGPVPAGLRLTGFEPGIDDPERPPGDPYPHGDFAKDSADKNDESKAVMTDNRTKFEAARDLATDAAALFLQDWIAQVNPAQLEALGEVDAHQGGSIPHWSPSVSLPLVVVGIVALALVLRPGRVH